MAVFTVNYRAAPAPIGLSLLQRAWVNVRHALAVHHTRQQLAAMDDRMLADIGVTRAEAGYEADLPIWDAGLR